MKNTIFLSVLVLSTNFCTAQQWNGSSTASGDIDRPGNVGIGFTPSGALPTNLTIQSSSGAPTHILIGATSFFPSAPVAGNGIHIQSNTYGGLMLFANKSGSSSDVFSFGTTSTNYLFCSNVSSTTKPFEILMGNGAGTVIRPFVIWPDGKVGIGTGTTTIGTNTKLAVEGMIACRELKVLPTATAWPDYVFEKDFSRMSINEVADYIDQYKHLPQLPPAAEVEQNGFEVGKTQAQILQAVEELYLHVIDLSKENEQLKKEIAALKQ